MYPWNLKKYNTLYHWTEIVVSVWIWTGSLIARTARENLDCKYGLHQLNSKIKTLEFVFFLWGIQVVSAGILHIPAYPHTSNTGYRVVISIPDQTSYHEGICLIFFTQPGFSTLLRAKLALNMVALMNLTVIIVFKHLQHYYIVIFVLLYCIVILFCCILY